MTKYNVKYFDLDTGAAAATVAEYGVTLNAAATNMLKEWEYGKVGFDKEKKYIIIKPHNDKEQAVGSIKINDIKGNKQYLRINSRDFVRTVAHYCKLVLNETGKYFVEWDGDEKVLIIDLNKKLEIKRKKFVKDGDAR